MKVFCRLFFLLVPVLLFSCKSKDGDYTIFTPGQDKMLGRQFATQLENGGEFEIMSPADYPAAYKHLNRIVTSILESESILHRSEFAWRSEAY